MTRARYGDTVKVHYTGRRQDGRVFASTSGREPVEVRVGDGEMIAGFEEGIVGMETHERKTIKVPPEEAYGPWLHQLVIDLGKDRFPDNVVPEVGQQLYLKKKDGSLLQVVVTDVSQNTVYIDMNHPLAGETLTFDIHLIEITWSL